MSLRSNPLDIREQYGKQLKDLRGRPVARPCWNCVPEKNTRPCRMHRIEPWLRHRFGKPWRGHDPEHPSGPSRRGYQGSADQALHLVEGPRRTVCYRPTKAVPKVDPRFAEPIRVMIEQEPSFGYRTVAWLPGFNKNTVQRVFQLKGWPIVGKTIRRFVF